MYDVFSLYSNNVGVAGGIALAEALSRNKTIDTVKLVCAKHKYTCFTRYVCSLCGNKIGDAGAIALAEALTRNTAVNTVK
jgi:hypothetical protein